MIAAVTSDATTLFRIECSFAVVLFNCVVEPVDRHVNCDSQGDDAMAPSRAVKVLLAHHLRAWLTSP